MTAPTLAEVAIPDTTSTDPAALLISAVAIMVLRWIRVITTEATSASPVTLVTACQRLAVLVTLTFVRAEMERLPVLADAVTIEASSALAVMLDMS